MRSRDVAGRRRRLRRILRSPLEHDLHTIAVGTRLFDHLRFGNSLHRLQLAVAALLSNTGGDAYLCRSAGGGAGGMAMGLRADECTDRGGDRRDSRSHCADPTWRPPRRDAGGGGAVGLKVVLGSQFPVLMEKLGCTSMF